MLIANNVSVFGTDDEMNPTQASDSDSETYKNLLPSIKVTKKPYKTYVTQGSQVIYTYMVTNISAAGSFDPLSGITLVDTDGTPSYVSGDANGNDVLTLGRLGNMYWPTLQPLQEPIPTR
ncbi:MAG: hypothetical protein ACK47R_23030 [Planctomycetia bacterium]